MTRTRAAVVVLALAVPAGCREDARIATVAEADDDDAAPAALDPADDAVAARGMLGVVVPRREIRLATDDIARIQDVLVEVGDRVEANTRVVVLDDSAERSELRSAQAGVRSAEAEARRLALQARHSSSEAARASKLAGIVSDDELSRLRHDEGSAALGSKRAGADAAARRAEADLIASRIEKSVLRAPFAGVVVERLADAGAIVGAGEPIVHVISDELVLRFAAPAAALERLAEGAAIHVSFVELGLELDTVVQTVAPEIDSATRIVMIEAALPLSPEQRARVRAGATARVRPAS